MICYLLYFSIWWRRESLVSSSRDVRMREGTGCCVMEPRLCSWWVFEPSALKTVLRSCNCEHSHSDLKANAIEISRQKDLRTQRNMRTHQSRWYEKSIVLMMNDWLRYKLQTWPKKERWELGFPPIPSCRRLYLEVLPRIYPWFYRTDLKLTETRRRRHEECDEWMHPTRRGRRLTLSVKKQ